MKLIDFLNSIDDIFDGELSGEYESQYGFCWGADTQITEKGQQRFKQILQSEIKIRDNSIIILQDKSISDEDYQLFMSAVAGYVPCSLYDTWFTNKE